MDAIEPPQDIADAIDREWLRLSRAGTWFDGTSRVAIAAAARGDQQPPDAPEAEAARAIYDAPAAIGHDWFTTLGERGLTAAQYVEVLGIVARLRAIDTLLFGLGQPRRPLPDPRPGEPSLEAVDDARLDGAWVPTVGVAFPPTVLSSVPAENAAMHELHGELYLAPSPDRDGFSMGNMAVVRDGLNRSQLEFVAARTSLLNDCFY